MSEKKLTRYLLWFAQEHIEFRVPEIEALAAVCNIQMKSVSNKPTLEPYWIVELNSENDAKLLANRSVSLRSILELWGHEKYVEKLHESLKKYPQHLVKSYLGADKSFKLEVETFGRHFTQKEKIEKLEEFSYLPIKSAVNLNNPDTHLQYIEYYGTRAISPPEEPYEVFFGRCVAYGNRQLIKKFSLKTRKFIGNTSMDPQLSLLMANHAKVGDGSIVLDPFVGSGSLLVAAAEFGGYVMGSDIDYLMLHGKTRPTRIKQTKRAEDESIRNNLRQYGLESRYVDVLINDFSMKYYKDSVSFDAIITDPPYGIRESTERIGTLKEDSSVSEEHLSTHYPAKVDYGISMIYSDLLLFATKHLTIGGRLVCWFPVFRDDYTEDTLPNHPCLRLVSNCEQTLSKMTSRLLLTYEKLRQPTDDELNINLMVPDFREKYFVMRDETRKERRIKNALEREENRLKYGGKQDK